MEMLVEIRRAVEYEIRMAFQGVTLGRGVSLRQARFADRSRDTCFQLAFRLTYA